jgi:transcription initiation factor IIE alpha subunit
MNDLILSTTGLARKSDPITSHLAAASVREFAPTHAHRVLRCLSYHGHCTADQIAAHTGMASQAVNKRLPELQRAGLALPIAGKLRPSDSGRMARVWSAA